MLSFRMKFLHLALFLAFCDLYFASEEDILELDDDNFASKIAEHESVLVMFYAPWCGHCKHLKPHYAKAAEELKTNDPPIILAKVDCTTAGKNTCKKYSIEGFPTLKIFKNGYLFQEYHGSREATGIVRYIRGKIGPSSKELSSQNDLDKFLTYEDVSVIGIFQEESDMRTAFFKIAEQMHDKVRFGHTFRLEVLYKQELVDGIILFRPNHLDNKFEKKEIKYNGASEFDDIQSFITKNYHGLVGHRTEENQRDFENPLVVAYYNVDYVKNTKATNYWRNRILKVAKEFSDDFTFAISSVDHFRNEITDMPVDLSKSIDSKPIVLARDENNEKYLLKEEFSMESFKDFLIGIKAGLLETFSKLNTGPIKIAVDTNFEEVVTKNGKDTLIKFYAAWCGNCKKIAPIFEKVGEKLENEDIEIVQMDASYFDAPPPYLVSTVPTIYWVPQNRANEPVRYNGDRSVDALLKFVAKHATHELKGFDRKGIPKKTEL